MGQFGSEYFKHTPELLCVFDLTGTVIDINPAWEKITGWTITELLSRPFIQFIHHDDRTHSISELKTFETTNGQHTTFGFENRFMQKQGTYLWLQWSASFVKSDNQIFCIVRDISKSKRESLLFEQTQQVSKVGSWEMDLTTNEFFWSKRTHEIHGTDPKTFKPSMTEEMASFFYSPEALSVLSSEFKKLQEKGESFDIELPFITLDKRSTWVRIVATSSSRDGVVISVFGTIEDIGQKKVEKTRYELIIEGSKLGTWDWDLETNDVFFNERFCDIIGLDYETVKHELATWDQLTHPEDKIIAYQDIKNYLEGKTSFYRNVHRMKHADGHWVWILDQGKIVEYQNGRPRRFSGTHTDITYLKELESERILLNDRFKLVLAAIEFGMWDWNIVDNILNWDESMYHLYGINKNEFKGAYEAWEEVLHPEDKEKAIAALNASIIDWIDFDVNFRIILPSGEVRHIAAKAYLERDSQGKAIRMTGINWDITNQVEQTRLFETIVNNIPIMITFYNDKNEIEWINPYWTETLGWTIDDLSGVNGMVAQVLADQSDHKRAVQFMEKAPNEWQEYTLLTKTGQKKHTIWTNVRLQDGKLIGIGQSIDEIKKQEELIKDQQAKMISSAKLSSLGEMASGIAHEINNPLTIIKGKAYHILKKLDLNAEEVNTDFLKKEITKIEQNSLRIVKIIKGLRTFSRHGEGDPFQYVPFRSILDDVKELCFERFKHEGVELKTNGDLDVILFCQETQMAQVLLNLINNAHDAVVNLENPWVNVYASSDDKIIKISVTDSGRGISEDIAQKIMQPFFTTKDVGVGTGLGLSISKGIVEMHGGKFYLDRSCPNTRFIIELPKHEKK